MYSTPAAWRLRWPFYKIRLEYWCWVWLYLFGDSACPYGTALFEVCIIFTITTASRKANCLNFTTVALRYYANAVIGKSSSAPSSRSIFRHESPLCEYHGVIRPTAECMGEITRSRHRRYTGHSAETPNRIGLSFGNTWLFLTLQ